MANKTERVKSLIMRNISEIIQFEVKNPAIGFVTVTDAKVSNDFSYAKVYVSFLGLADSKERLEALNHSKGYIRSSLSKKLDIRKVPEISFVLDDTYEKAQHLEATLKQAQEKKPDEE